jgi:hypothetical protein
MTPHMWSVFVVRSGPTPRRAQCQFTPIQAASRKSVFGNVRQRLARAGGRIRFGWAIWEWPRVYIEAEHHAIYEAPSGEWQDITPSANPDIVARLFLPDDSATYDFAHEGVRRENHRLALADDPLIERFFQSAIRFNEIMNRVPGVGMIQIDREVAEQLRAAQLENLRLTVELGLKYTRPNSPCFCGSRQKFKHCHGECGGHDEPTRAHHYVSSFRARPRPRQDSACRFLEFSGARNWILRVRSAYALA